jgi:hypothetical protein
MVRAIDVGDRDPSAPLGAGRCGATEVDADDRLDLGCAAKETNGTMTLCEALRVLHEQLAGEATFSTMKHCLTVKVVGVGRGTFNADCELRDPRERTRLTFSLVCDQTELPNVLRDMNTVLRTFRGGPALSSTRTTDGRLGVLNVNGVPSCPCAPTPVERDSAPSRQLTLRAAAS